MEPGQNTGVIIEFKPTDFFVGAETGIEYKPLTDGQWDTYLPDEETQYRNLLDVFGCVSFSALNCLEDVYNYKVAKSLFSPVQIKFLKDEGYVDHLTNKVNFSDRFTAKMSGTTKGGNSLGAVGDSIRKLHGLVPEKDWAWPVEITDGMLPDQKWDIYYKAVPQAVIEKGKRFLEHFDISYQWLILGSGNVEVVFKKWLPCGPIQIASAVCAPWNSNEANPPIKGCGCGTQHATKIYGFNDKVSWKDFDTYKSYRKLLDWNYCFPYAMQYYVEEKKPVTPSDFHYVYNMNLKFGDPAIPEVRKLQQGLQTIKDKNGQTYMKIGTFGPYGPATKDSVDKFQIDNGIVDPGRGTNFGPQTRSALNLLLK